MGGKGAYLFKQSFQKATVCHNGDATLRPSRQPLEKFQASLFTLLIILLVLSPSPILLVWHLQNIYTSGDCST